MWGIDTCDKGGSSGLDWLQTPLETAGTCHGLAEASEVVFSWDVDGAKLCCGGIDHLGVEELEAFGAQVPE